MIMWREGEETHDQHMQSPIRERIEVATKEESMPQVERARFDVHAFNTKTLRSGAAGTIRPKAAGMSKSPVSVCPSVSSLPLSSAFTLLTQQRQTLPKPPTLLFSPFLLRQPSDLGFKSNNPLNLYFNLPMP